MGLFEVYRVSWKFMVFFGVYGIDGHCLNSD